MSNVYALDCETTGLKNHSIYKRPQIIELAYIPLESDFQNLKSISKIENQNSFLKLIEELVDKGTVNRYRPSMPIDKRATEVHGIHFRDLLKCPKSESLTIPETTQYLLGHNISYDYRCLGKPDNLKCICTLFLAKKLDKKFGIGFPNHKLDTLTLYFYGEKARPLIENSHQALTDTIKVVVVLAKLLEYVPNVNNVDELFSFYEMLKRI